MRDVAICIEPVFVDLPYPERIKKIAALGYKKYEFWQPDRSMTKEGMIQKDKDLTAFAELNAQYGLEITAMLYSPSEGGIKLNMISREDTAKLVDNFGAVTGLAKKVGCKALMVAGGTLIPGQSNDISLMNLFHNLSVLASEAEKQGVTLLLEPLNSKVDHRDTFLSDPRLAVDMVSAVNNPFCKLLYDIYHMQIMAGNILDFVRENLRYIGHFHIAGVPGRHEPYSGELDYGRIVRAICDMGYPGCFGLEYWPAEADTEASLRKSLVCITDTVA
jgi:hydroxypyruvate isomerase